MDNGFTKLSQMSAMTLHSREPLPIPPSTFKTWTRSITLDQNSVPHHQVDGNMCQYNTGSESVMKDMSIAQHFNVFAQKQKDVVEERILRREKRPKMERETKGMISRID